MIRIEIFYQMSESLKKKGIRSQTMKCESRSRRSEKKIHEKTPLTRRTGAMFCVFPTNRGKKEANTKSESRTEGGVQKKEGKTSCTLYLHQFFKLFFPQTPAETTTNMVLCRGNIFSKEMTVTSKHMFLCERNL